MTTTKKPTVKKTPAATLARAKAPVKAKTIAAAKAPPKAKTIARAKAATPPAVVVKVSRKASPLQARLLWGNVGAAQVLGSRA